MTGSRSIDWKKAYGRVTPPMNGACYWQDGHYFDGSGLEILPNGQAAQVEDDPETDPLDHDGDGKPGGSKPSDARGLDDLYAEASALGVAVDRRWGEPRLKKEIAKAKALAAPKKRAASPAPPPTPIKEQPPAADELDLAGWAKGTKRYLTGDVYKALREKYAVVITTERDAINLLIDEGVVPVVEARKVA